MFARALFAFLALPGTVAFLIPLLIAPRGDNRFVRSAGPLPLVVGTALLLWCVREASASRSRFTFASGCTKSPF